MNRRIGWALVLLGAVAALPGCMPKGASGADVDSPAEVIDISISPKTATIVPGSSVVLTAIAHMSDGSEHPVSAAWSLDAAAVAALSETAGATVAVDGVALGVVHVLALSSGRATSAQVTVVDWLPPVLKTPVFGIKSGKEGIVQYDDAGVPAYVPTGVAAAWGLAVDRDASRYHVVGKVDGIANPVIRSFNTAAPGVAVNQGEIPELLAFYGLDVAADGKVVCQAFGSGNVYRYSPVTGAVAAAGKLKITMQISLALTPAGDIMTSPMITGPGSTMILRQDPVAVTQKLWATVPYDIQTNAGYVTAVGLAIDDDGAAYVINYEGLEVYRLVDTNGDGLALLEEETVPYASIPALIAPSVGGICGLSNAGGRGGLLVNAMRVDGVNDPTLGIYFVSDRDHNGSADDVGSVVLFSATAVPNDQDTGCVAAGR